MRHRPPVYSGVRGLGIIVAGNATGRVFWPQFPVGLFVRGVHMYLGEATGLFEAPSISLATFSNTPADTAAAFANGRQLFNPSQVALFLQSNGGDISPKFFALNLVTEEDSRTLGFQLDNLTLSASYNGILTVDLGENDQRLIQREGEDFVFDPTVGS